VRRYRASRRPTRATRGALRRLPNMNPFDVERPRSRAAAGLGAGVRLRTARVLRERWAFRFERGGVFDTTRPRDGARRSPSSASPSRSASSRERSAIGHAHRARSRRRAAAAPRRKRPRPLDRRSSGVVGDVKSAALDLEERTGRSTGRSGAGREPVADARRPHALGAGPVAAADRERDPRRRRPSCRSTRPARWTRRWARTLAQRGFAMRLLGLFARPRALLLSARRHLGRHRLQRLSAHPGDRHPHGARRAAARRPAACCSARARRLAGPRRGHRPRRRVSC
jgi:hypothetical protein